jgi:hypothetical protein
VTDAGYVLGGYALTAAALGGYVARTLWRARTLGRSPERRPPATPSDTGPAAPDGP